MASPSALMPSSTEPAHLSFMGNTKAGLPWSTEEVMGNIVSFLRQHLGS